MGGGTRVEPSDSDAQRILKAAGLTPKGYQYWILAGGTKRLPTLRRHGASPVMAQTGEAAPGPSAYFYPRK